MDLDDFKLVNDTLGHQIGDRVLVEVAERLKRCLREADTAARLGGDEFAVVLEDVAERFQAQLRAPLDFREHWLFATTSIGIAVGAKERPEELLRAADTAMYQAKGTGKAHYMVFDPSA